MCRGQQGGRTGDITCSVSHFPQGDLPLLHVSFPTTSHACDRLLTQIWRQREADHVASLKARHAQEVRQLHSLYRQRAPYEAVVGKTRLSELKRQLRLQVRVMATGWEGVAGLGRGPSSVHAVVDRTAVPEDSVAVIACWRSIAGNLYTAPGCAGGADLGTLFVGTFTA